jgi:hypothetical protein
LNNVKTQSERALVAWAILGDAVKKADLYEGLFDFIRPIADSRVGKRFIPSELCEAVQERYGLNMPVLVMESLAARLAKAGLLSVNSKTIDVVSYVYAQSTTTPPNPITEKAIADMLERFRQFIRAGSPENIVHTDTNLDKAFFERLMHVESLALLSRRDIPEAPKRTKQTLTLPLLTASDSAVVNREDEHIDYLFASFLLQVRDETPVEFELLCEIAGANLVAETLLTYRDPPLKGEALQDLSIYLDAPLCIDILGVNVGRVTYGEELIRTLKTSGIDICVFLHSVNEIENILEARRASYLQTSQNGPSIHAIEPVEIRDRVRIIAGHVEETLISKLNCRIVDSVASVPAPIRARVGATEERLIRDALQGWQSESGREVDISTVCDLIRLRSTKDVPTRIPAAGPTLATRNSVVKRTANEAWHQWLLHGNRATKERLRRAAPLAISDRNLAGLIWITQGGSIGQVSRELLVANCSAATAARRDVVVRVHNTLVSTSPEDAKLFSAVIMDQRAERALMDATYGDPQVVNDENVQELLETMKRATVREITMEKDAQIKIVENELDITKADLREKNAQLEGVRIANEFADSLAKEKKRKLLIEDQESVEISFQTTCTIYRYLGLVIGLSLALLTLVIQALLPDAVKSLTDDSFVSKVMKSPLTPLVVGFIPALISTYEFPDFIFGGTRKKISDSIFQYLLKRKNLNNLLIDGKWDFKDKTLVFVEIENSTNV